MDYIIENLTDKPIWPRLNSGACIHVDPQSRSAPVAQSEVIDNSKLKKLSDQNVIRVHSAPAAERKKGAPTDDKDTAPDEAGEKRDAGKGRK